MKPKRKRSKSPRMKRQSEIEELNIDGTFPSQEETDDYDKGEKCLKDIDVKEVY